MQSQNDIANLALGRLGVSLRVEDVATENSQQAKVIRQHYQSAFTKVIEMHPWKFLNKQAALNLIAQDPNENFRYEYQYPADAQIIREVACEGFFSYVELYEDQKVYFEEAYKANGPVIHTNVQFAHAKYTVKLPITANVPEHFADAVAAQLSMAIAPSLITNNFAKIGAVLNADARNTISDCIARDESRQPQKLDAYNPFYRARLGC